MEYSFQRYLAAKKTVDDQALNSHVWNKFKSELEGLQNQRPVNILEVGAGIGTMLERLLERDALRKARYKAMDAVQENMAALPSRLGTWARQNSWGWKSLQSGWQLGKAQNSVQLELECADVTEFSRRPAEAGAWEVLVAAAFLDLFDVRSILDLLGGLISPGGLALFSINFDGLTEFEPVPDPAIEERILDAYHRSMDERLMDGLPSGDSRAGRHLFTLLPQAGFTILEAGSSDWVVYPRAGGYRADEAYFLHHILHFFEESLAHRPEVSPDELASWTTLRHAQVERGELVYIAHQLDFLARESKRG